MNNKKKIMHIITGLNIGGTEIFLSRLLPMLSDFDHVVVSLTNRGEIGGALEGKGVRVYELKGGKWFSPLSIFRFSRIIREEKPDVLSTWLLHADIFGRIFGKIFGIKKIISNIRVALPVNKYRPYLILSKLTSGLVDYWTANSKIVFDFCIDELGAPKDKTALIYNGVDISKFDIPVNPAEKRSELGISLDDYVVISVARLEAQKNIQALITVALEIGAIKNDRDFVFLIVGDGSERQLLKDATKGSKNIKFLGNRNDIPELLKMSDVFVLPTLFEGLSNAILEAMTVGLPVITTDIKENREIIANHENGLLIPVSDMGKIKDSILSISENKELQIKIKENSKKTIGEKFNSSISVERFGEIFNEVLSE